MSDQDYLSRNRGYITSSKLEAFRFCQYLYFLQYVQELVPDKTSDAMLFGSCFDDFWSYGEEEWNKKYIVVSRKIDPFELADRIETKKSLLEKAKTPQTKEKYSAEIKELERFIGKTQLAAAMGEKLQRCNFEANRQPLWKFDPKDAQVEIVVDYKGTKLKCTIDQLRLKEKLICDVKTSGAIDILMKRFQEKYVRQLSFYQFLVEIEHDVKCDGQLQVATTEDPSHFVLFSLSKEGLLDRRVEILKTLDELIAAEKRGIFLAQPQDCRVEKCFDCAAYGVCPHSVQRQIVPLC